MKKSARKDRKSNGPLGEYVRRRVQPSIDDFAPACITTWRKTGRIALQALPLGRKLTSRSRGAATQKPTFCA